MAVPDETLADTRYTRLTGHAVLSKGHHNKEGTIHLERGLSRADATTAVLRHAPITITAVPDEILLP
jgi:hypothetical protein